MQISLLLIWMLCLPFASANSKGFRLQMLSQGEDGSYDFSYDTGDGTYHIQSRDTQGTVTGKFAYVDPDGRLREVGYTADERGFQPAGDILPPYPSGKNDSNSTSFTILFPQLNDSSIPKPPEGQPVPGDPGNNILNPKLGGLLGPPRIDGALVPPLPKLGSSRGRTEKRPTGSPMLLEERTAMAIPGKERFNRFDPPPRRLLDPTTTTTTTTKRTTSKTTRSQGGRSAPIPIAPLLSTGQIPISYNFRNVLTTQPNLNAPAPTAFPQQGMNNHRLPLQHRQEKPFSQSEGDSFPSDLNGPILTQYQREDMSSPPFFENETPPTDILPDLPETPDKVIPELHPFRDSSPPPQHFLNQDNIPLHNLALEGKETPLDAPNLRNRVNQINQNQLPINSNIRTSRGFPNNAPANHVNVGNNFHEYRGRILQDSSIPHLSRTPIGHSGNNPLPLPPQNTNAQRHLPTARHIPANVKTPQRTPNFEGPPRFHNNPMNSNYPPHPLSSQQRVTPTDERKMLAGFIGRPDPQFVPESKALEQASYHQGNPVSPQPSAFQMIPRQSEPSHTSTRERINLSDGLRNQNRNSDIQQQSQIVLSLPDGDQFSRQFGVDRNNGNQEQFYSERPGPSDAEQNFPTPRRVNINDEIRNRNTDSDNLGVQQESQDTPLFPLRGQFQHQSGIRDDQQQFHHRSPERPSEEQIRNSGDHAILQQPQVVPSSLDEFPHQMRSKGNQEPFMQKPPYMTVRYNIPVRQNPTLSQMRVNVNSPNVPTSVPTNRNGAFSTMQPEPDFPHRSSSLNRQNTERLETPADNVRSPEEQLSIFDYPHPPTREPPKNRSPASPGVIPPLPISRAALQAVTRNRETGVAETPNWGPSSNAASPNHGSQSNEQNVQFNEALNKQTERDETDHSFNIQRNAESEGFDSLPRREDLQRPPLSIPDISNERIPSQPANPLTPPAGRVPHSIPESSPSREDNFQQQSSHSLQPRHMQRQSLTVSEIPNAESNHRESVPHEPSAFSSENAPNSGRLQPHPSSLSRSGSNVQERPLTFSQAHILPVFHRLHLAPPNQIIRLANSGANLHNRQFQSVGQSSTISSVSLPPDDNTSSKVHMDDEQQRPQETLDTSPTTDQQHSLANTPLPEQQKPLIKEDDIQQSTSLDNSKQGEASEGGDQTATPIDELRPIVHKGPVINSPLFTPIEALRTVSGKEVIERTYVPLTRRYGYFFRQQPAGFR